LRAQHLKGGAFLEASSGVTVTDLDGNVFYDLTGSYGVNVFGYDFYKECIARRRERVEALGPVLGAYHPLRRRQRARLREISGLDEVSFHMSGTEAVMQAVRLARYHTGAPTWCASAAPTTAGGATCSPGVGNPVPRATDLHAEDMHADSLRVLRTRKDIACVLVNPLQALHPNANRAGDSSLVDGGRAPLRPRGLHAWLRRCARSARARHRADLRRGVRGLPPRTGRRAGILRRQADMVTYGKTLGGGLPVGVVCGKRDLMKRYRDDRPADICFARGTFNSHPYVMGAMQSSWSARHAGGAGGIYATSTSAGTAAPRASTRVLEEAACPCGWPTVHGLDRDPTPGRRATTGCSSTTCAPRAWR
jgi:glutamate-1-semialdehyde 2,1-aminomutase